MEEYEKIIMLQDHHYFEKKYPTLFKHEYGGIAFDKGWYPIFNDLCDELQNFTEMHFTCIKEKFGTMRIYYDVYNNEGKYVGNSKKDIDDIIEKYVNRARSTCEKCGKNGATNKYRGNWCQTLCSLC